MNQISTLFTLCGSCLEKRLLLTVKMVTTSDLRNIFEKRMSSTPNSSELFHPKDLERVKDDTFLQRVLDHEENNLKDAAETLWGLLKWRKEIGANDINENNLKMEYMNEGIIFPRGRDINGCLLLIFKFKLHVKGKRNYDELKRVIVYWLDRIEREEKGKMISMVFDMDGTGLSNMDIDLIKDFIGLFNYYYPNFVNYIIIFNMPWIMNAAFKVVKSLLPAKAIESLKFVNHKTLKDVVPREHALKCWGGLDDYVFKFIPENSQESQTPNSKLEQSSKMLRVTPTTIVFYSHNKDIVGQFTITNITNNPTAFKIRTNSPQKFCVRPGSGTLAAGESHQVHIQVQNGFSKILNTDKFLVISTKIPKLDIPSEKLVKIWQNPSNFQEYKLQCEVANTTEGKAVHETNNNIVDTLNCMQNDLRILRDQIQNLRFIQYLTLLLAIMAILLIYFITY